MNDTHDNFTPKPNATQTEIDNQRAANVRRGRSDALRQSEEQDLIADQREANAQMVSVTIQAQELMEKAEAATARAEAATAQAEAASNALRESEERYRTLFEVSPVALYSCDTSGTIQKFNRNAAELWGREPALGDTDERFCGSFKMFRTNGSFMPHEQCPMAEVLSGKIPEVRDTEVLIERPNGSQVTVIVNIRPVKNQHGEVTAAINCFYDITERKHMEEARSQVAAIVESSDDAILSKDLHRVITSWNKSAERLFGYTAQEAIGQSTGMLIPSDLPDEEFEILRRLNRGESVDHFETVRRRKDGSLLEISLTVSPVTNRKGHILGVSEIARDITERKEAERALRAVAEFRELFIGILGHDLRNPLSAIDMAAARLLQRGHLDAKDAETVARVIRSSQRMVRMITQVLDLTRARLGGGLLIKLEPADLGQVCRNVVEEFGSTVQVKFAGDLTGSWDRDRLEEVLSNLTGNAIQYAKPGTPVVVKAHADGAEVVVEISNQGDAIPEDVLPFIFEPFRRARQLEKSASGNLGLGLYIAHQIVLSHSGSLEAHCANGTTTFVMRLPRRLVELQVRTEAAISD